MNTIPNFFIIGGCIFAIAFIIGLVIFLRGKSTCSAPLKVTGFSIMMLVLAFVLGCSTLENFIFILQ